MGISSGPMTLKFWQSPHFQNHDFEKGKIFSPERRSKVVKFAKNGRLDPLIVLARDEQLLFFPWKWSKGWTIGQFFPHFLALQNLISLRLFTCLSHLLLIIWVFKKKDQVIKWWLDYYRILIHVEYKGNFYLELECCPAQPDLFTYFIQRFVFSFPLNMSGRMMRY